jgi:AcrR family transcriptional regulator
MSTNDEDLTSEAILEILEAAHAHEEPEPNEGLRDRKKRRLRQRISNVATALFLAEGFDQVSVVRIAGACEVSEQTVFNYFPTKESMFFDRTDSSTDALAAAVRHRGERPLGVVVVDVLLGGSPVRAPGMNEAQVLRLYRRFCMVSESSPALRAAAYADVPRFIATIGATLAARIGAHPDDPEVQLTAMVIAGLLRVRTQATYTHVQTTPSIAALESAVRADVIRALHIATPTLDTFDRLQPTDRAGAVPRNADAPPSRASSR